MLVFSNRRLSQMFCCCIGFHCVKCWLWMITELLTTKMAIIVNSHCLSFWLSSAGPISVLFSVRPHHEPELVNLCRSVFLCRSVALCVCTFVYRCYALVCVCVWGGGGLHTCAHVVDDHSGWLTCLTSAAAPLHIPPSPNQTVYL